MKIPESYLPIKEYAKKFGLSVCAIQSAIHRKRVKNVIMIHHKYYLDGEQSWGDLCQKKIGKTKHPMYGAWINMRRRCNDPKRHMYHRYGGRGIDVCEEWNDFWAFAQWGESVGWNNGLTIDRIDNDAGYSPDNCRVVTLQENNRARKGYSRKQKFKVYNAVFHQYLEQQWYVVKNEYRADWMSIFSRWHKRLSQYIGFGLPQSTIEEFVKFCECSLDDVLPELDRICCPEENIAREIFEADTGNRLPK